MFSFLFSNLFISFVIYYFYEFCSRSKFLLSAFDYECAIVNQLSYSNQIKEMNNLNVNDRECEKNTHT